MNVVCLYVVFVRICVIVREKGNKIKMSEKGRDGERVREKACVSEIKCEREREQVYGVEKRYRRRRG